MRLAVALTVFGTVLFGVGWTSHWLIGNDRDRSRSSCASSRHGPAGPYLATVEKYASELRLDSGQLARLEELKERTSAAVLGLEDAIQGQIELTRAQVEDLLTDAQERLLDQLVEERWERHRQKKLRRAAEFLACRGHGAETIDAVVTILRAYELQKADYFKELHWRGEWPDPEQWDEQLETFRLAASAEMGLHLVPGEVDALWADQAGRCKSSCGSRDGDRAAQEIRQ